MEEITLTQDELNKKLQAEADKRVQQALETAKAKWEQESSQKLETEKAEAERLAKLSEEERYKAEMQKQREEFEAERKKFEKERLELETTKILASENLPTDFSNFLIGENTDSTKTNIDVFKTSFQKAVEKAVDERLKGSSKPPVSAGGGVPTEKKFEEMSVQEQLKLQKENPELFKEMTKGFL